MPDDAQVANDESVPRRSGWRRFIFPQAPPGGRRARLLWWARRFAIFYVSVSIMIALLQRYLIYQPTTHPGLDARLHATGLPMEDVSVTSTDGLTLHGWKLPARVGPGVADPKRRPYLLYFSGNAGHRGYRTGEMDVLSRLGVNVYLFDYRGYGENAGKPTEANLVADARAAWDFVLKTEGVQPGDVYVYGESLGGGVATPLAAELSEAGTPPRGLVLRATFASLVDAAAYHFPWLPVRLLLLDRFPSIDRIGKVSCPTLIVHGKRDTIVPFAHSRRMFDAAPAQSAGGVPKMFFELTDADHNDILYAGREQYIAALRAYFAKVDGPTP